MRKLALLPLLALLLPSLPASASSLVMVGPVRILRPADARPLDRNGCSLPQLSIRTDGPLVLSPKVGSETPVDWAVVPNPWASGATSHWNDGMNRAVDRLFKQPEHVKVYATQTGDDLRGHFEGANSPNETFAAFEVVIH